jgi:transcriptional regulator with XRE-family HTH domain
MLRVSQVRRVQGPAVDMPSKKRPAAETPAPRRLRIDATDIALGARIRVRRLELKLSQQAMAESLGVTYQQLQKYERGLDRVSVNMLVKIAARLGCTTAALLGEETGAADDRVAPQLAVPGAMDLLDIYSRIESPSARKRVLDLLKELAGARLGDAPAKTWHAQPAPWRRGPQRKDAPAAAPPPPRRRGRPRLDGT